MARMYTKHLRRFFQIYQQNLPESIFFREIFSFLEGQPCLFRGLNTMSMECNSSQRTLCWRGIIRLEVPRKRLMKTPMQVRVLDFILWRYGSLADRVATQGIGGATHVGLGAGTGRAQDLSSRRCGHWGMWEWMDELAMYTMVSVKVQNSGVSLQWYINMSMFDQRLNLMKEGTWSPTQMTLEGIPSVQYGRRSSIITWIPKWESLYPHFPNYFWSLCHPMTQSSC